ncbi:hypothetical protein GLAREA_00087 [Glarea lozoyensis ATCC 20868]|uniref:Transmembrane protein n=1 Tax=Glarea lozoyensis (strain ATCC 20868 / MF5171) TaxID=1116229 RepID=S3CVE7_GLAL2|nr:uncharacterized protein GLAREA_00087 [Glarea lozoyensis ATCC 20868]EPE28929.1 hypothetical protein GLAREA_00087 [Glarea lozoyensis ATCC 20868]
MSLARRIILGAFKLVGNSKRQNVLSVPTVCFAQCNDAYTEAQRVGKSPALCADGSAFLVDVDFCNLCVVKNSAVNLTQSQTTYIVPEFEPFLSFCGASPGGESAYIMSVQSAASSLGLFSTATLSTTLYLTRNASEIGSSTTINRLISPPTSTPTNIPVVEQKRPTWIAGAVLGPLFMVCTVLAFLMIWRRRQRRPYVTTTEEKKEDTLEEKAQLHADSLALYELPSERYNELSSEHHSIQALEMEALEPVGSELSAWRLSRGMRNS